MTAAQGYHVFLAILRDIKKGMDSGEQPGETPLLFIP